MRSLQLLALVALLERGASASRSPSSELLDTDAGARPHRASVVLTCGVEHDLPLLGHSLRHWTQSLGVAPQDVHVVLNHPDASDPGFSQGAAEAASHSLPEGNVRQWVGAYSDQERKRQENAVLWDILDAHAASPDVELWLAPVDCDELPEPDLAQLLGGRQTPPGMLQGAVGKDSGAASHPGQSTADGSGAGRLSQVLEAIHEAGLNVLGGQLVNRVTRDGSLPAVQPGGVDLAEQFPLRCPWPSFDDGSQSKVVALHESLAGLYISGKYGGHHLSSVSSLGFEARCQPLAELVPTGHFKWSSNVLAKMNAMRHAKTKAGEASESVRYDKMLLAIEAHGGRYPLDGCADARDPMPLSGLATAERRYISCALAQEERRAIAAGAVGAA